MMKEFCKYVVRIKTVEDNKTNQPVSGLRSLAGTELVVLCLGFPSNNQQRTQRDQRMLIPMDADTREQMLRAQMDWLSCGDVEVIRELPN